MSAIQLVKPSGRFPAGEDHRQLVRDALAAKPDGVVEQIARDCGVPSQVVLEALPAGQRMFVAPEAFEHAWTSLTDWGTCCSSFTLPIS